MKTKEENNRKDGKISKSLILDLIKNNWIKLLLSCLTFIIIIYLVSSILTSYWNKKSLENDINNISNDSVVSINKVICYSSAYGINNEKNQARWNLDISQYTDMAIYLNVQTSISNMYIDNISFAKSETGVLSLSSLPLDDFAKSPISNSEVPTENSTRIELELSSPIILRYLNYNLKKNYLVTDIENPISFDGSILKRGKVTLSSLKNIVYFTLHVIDLNGNEFTCPVSIPINLENDETQKSIYDGSYVEEISPIKS